MCECLSCLRNQNNQTVRQSNNQMMNEIPATVYILDRPYKLKIEPDDEQFLRGAARLIDSQAKNYGKMYAFGDRQDLLAMVALTQITQLLKLKDKQQFRDTRLEDRLIEINRLLENRTIGVTDNRIASNAGYSQRRRSKS